jgi:hypothetical protein
MTLVKRPFGESFTFARSIAADYRDAAGDVVTAPVNVPRFDHAVDGTPKGLLVEPGPALGQHDALQTQPGWEVGVEKATVLHEYEMDGQIRRVAFYTSNAKAMADGCCRAAVHHRSLIAVEGYLRNRGGYVRYDGRNWDLGSALAVQPGPLASPVLADEDGRLLIEG